MRIPSVEADTAHNNLNWQTETFVTVPSAMKALKLAWVMKLNYRVLAFKVSPKLANYRPEIIQLVTIQIIG